MPYLVRTVSGARHWIRDGSTMIDPMRAVGAEFVLFTRRPMDDPELEIVEAEAQQQPVADDESPAEPHDDAAAIDRPRKKRRKG